jgi:hypothetical protein
MPIKDTKWVASVEAGKTSKGGPMWTITWHDGKKDKIFDSEWAQLADEAFDSGGAVYIEHDKSAQGYWNITRMELMKDKVTEVPASPPIPSQQRTDTVTPAKGVATPAPQEMGMWWKELGNRIGDGSLEKDYPKAHVRIKGQYYKKMSEVTGVSFKAD